MWEPQLTLAGPFRVIRIDHRGHGGSPVPPGPYAMPDLAADVLALLDTLGLARVAYCGLSLGGMVGMYLGSEHPRPAHQPHAVLHHRALRRPRPVGRADRRGRGGRDGRRSPTPSSAAGSPRRGRPRTRTSSPRCATRSPRTPDAGYLGCCRAIAAWDHRERLVAVAVPTLVIGGRGRHFHPGRAARPHARRRHPRRPSGGAPRRAPRDDRERRASPPADFGARRGHNFVTTPD